MKQTITIILIILTSQYAFAQKGQITGVIHQDPTAPLPYVTITVKENRGIPLAAGISDDKETFSLENIPSGNHTISYSLIGFETISKPVEVKSNEQVNIGTVLLEPDAKLLEAVKINGQRAAVSLKLDKKVFEVGKDILSQSGAVTDLLNINVTLIQYETLQ